MKEMKEIKEIEKKLKIDWTKKPGIYPNTLSLRYINCIKF